MPVVLELDVIKNMLCNESNVVYDVPIQVSSYRHVLDEWINFKTFKKFKKLFLKGETNLVREVFKFHRSDTDHIILYYSKNMRDCLLMCRVKGKYINLLVPAKGISELDKNIIATYC